MLTQCSKNVNVGYGKEVVILTGPREGVPSYHAGSQGKAAVLVRKQKGARRKSPPEPLLGFLKGMKRQDKAE